MERKIAFIFPGQGSQVVGMGKDMYENFQAAKDVYDLADTTLGRKISTLCFEGPEEDLKQTANTQPAIVTTSIAMMEVLREKLNITPDFVAGHSLGEYCAMFTAGVMSLETTLRAIQKRADLMNEISSGSMVAVLNASNEVLQEALKEGSKVGYVDIANYNSPSQVVLTGDNDAVKKASEYLTANGVKRVIPLAVSGAFHSKFLENAAQEFAEFISEIELNDASVPVITNIDAEPTIDAEDFREKMPEQMYSSVYWTQTIQKMVSEGVDTFIEIGPGKVLAGLNKKIVSEGVNVYNVYDSVSLETTVGALKEEMIGV